MCVNSPEYLEAFFAAQKLGCGAGERELPLRRRRARVPARQLRRGRARVPRRLRGRRSPTRSRRCPPTAGRGCCSRSRTPAAATCSTARATTSRRSPAPHRRSRRPTREPSGDDLVFLYTGGTTGSPKAVMWRSDDLYVSLWQMARPGTEPPDVEAAIARRQARRDAACPRARSCTAPGCSSRCRRSSGGGTVVLLDTPRLDADAVWDAVEREHVQVCTIVGDAFARPLLAALDAAPDRWDLSGLRAITSSGVTWSPETKRGLLAHLPARDADRLARRVGRDHDAHRDARRRRHRARAVQGERTRRGRHRRRRRSCSPATTRSACSASAARSRSATTRTPRRPRRRSAPSTAGATRSPATTRRVDADGTIRLLGRGSACINTGGEKVYPEEVELALRVAPRRVRLRRRRRPRRPLGRDGRRARAAAATAHARRRRRSRAHCRATLAGVQGAEAVRRASTRSQRSPGGQGRLQAAARASRRGGTGRT